MQQTFYKIMINLCIKVWLIMSTIVCDIFYLKMLLVGFEPTPAFADPDLNRTRWTTASKKPNAN